MSDGSGGAPQLDEQALEAAIQAVHRSPGDIREEVPIAIRAYLAASSGGGELGPSSEERRAMVKAMMERGGRTSSLTTRELCEWWLEAALDALVRARLDRKDDER
jgi:hypothetical protein